MPSLGITFINLSVKEELGVKRCHTVLAYNVCSTRPSEGVAPNSRYYARRFSKGRSWRLKNEYQALLKSHMTSNTPADECSDGSSASGTQKASVHGQDVL